MLERNINIKISGSRGVGKTSLAHLISQILKSKGGKVTIKETNIYQSTVDKNTGEFDNVDELSYKDFDIFIQVENDIELEEQLDRILTDFSIRWNTNKKGLARSLLNKYIS